MTADNWAGSSNVFKYVYSLQYVIDALQYRAPRSCKEPGMTRWIFAAALTTALAQTEAELAQAGIP